MRRHATDCQIGAVGSRWLAIPLITIVLAACGSGVQPTAGEAAGHATAMVGASASGGHGGHAMGQAPGAALSAEENGYGLIVDGSDPVAGTEANLRFRITRNDATQRDFELEQTKPLHLIVVHRALIDYQHLHPTQQQDGSWSVPLTAAYGGTYRVIADFTPVADGSVGARTALGTDVNVTGPPTNASIPPPSATDTVDGFTVTYGGKVTAGTATSPVTFTVSKQGAPVTTLEPYLGAYGHLVAISAADVGYTHLHPMAEANGGAPSGPSIEFMAAVHESGVHRLFLQFQVAGAVHTAAFTVAIP